MNGGLEHRECAEGLAAFALDALSGAEAARVQRHLSECRECRAELDWLRAGVEVLPASVPPIEPPPELKRRVMEVVDAEAELLRAAGAEADRPQRARTRPLWHWPTGLGLRAAIGFAAACIAVVAVVLAVTAGGSPTRVIRAQITDPALVGRVRASLQVRGTRAELVLRGLPAPPADHVDELWVKRGSAAPAPAGTFVLVSGSVEVGRPVRRGDVVLVTVEPGSGASAPTTSPVIAARA